MNLAVTSKKRIFQVARELNISNEALISFLDKLNFKVRNHMALLTDEMYAEIEKKYKKEVDISEKDFDFKRKLREKKIREEEKRLEEQRKYEEKVRTSYLIMSEKPHRVSKTAARVTTTELPPPDKIEIEDEVTVIELHEPVVDEPKIEQPSVIEISQDETEKEEDKEFSKDAEEAVKELISKQEKETRKKKEITEEPVIKITEEKDKEAEIKKITPVKSVETQKKPEKRDLDRELELKLIRKIKVKKEKPEAIGTAEVPATKRTPRKKLKAKERLSEGEKIGIEEEIEPTPKKKKKKKREKHIEVEEYRKEKYKKKYIVTEEPSPEKFRKKSKKRKKIQISEQEITESIRQTFSLMKEGGKTKKRKKRVKYDEEVVSEESNILRLHEFISVGELASEMDVEPGEVIKKCLELGTLVSINQRLDEETIVAVADEFGFEVEIVPEYGSEKFEEIEELDDESYAVPRPPVVTIMGHVDHGKTSLLDYIRESNIAFKETGGITQHIGAYEVNVNGKSITFLDTPGHEAFTAMRARGAQVTDIVVLVVAADDSVMPQTIEAIDHAKAAEVPIIVAINKIDKSNANPELIKKQLAEHEVLIESWGGKYQAVEISAKTGEGIDKLLESILVEAEILELKANPDRLARGVVIESKLDKGKGVVATVLIQKGLLKIGDPFISGQYSGKVRGLFNDKGVKTKIAGPSLPVLVLGFSGLPQAGDSFIVLESERDTKDISLRRQQIKREQEFRRVKHLTLDQISKRIKEGEVKELSIILKGDVDGSVEAIGDSLVKLSNKEVAVKIIRKGVGAISESDVLLAYASNAVILGFQVRPTIKAREIAQRENVDIRLYKIIYDAISDVKDALEGLLEPEFEEKNLSVTEVRQTFRVPKIGVVAGCYVVSGKITRNDRAKLFRDDKLVHESKITSLKRFKEDVKEVIGGFECGLVLEGFDDIKVNDIIETYKIDEIKRTLTMTK